MVLKIVTTCIVLSAMAFGLNLGKRAEPVSKVRLIKAILEVDGKEMLKSSWSDHGRRNADQVWDDFTRIYRRRLRPTKQFDPKCFKLIKGTKDRYTLSPANDGAPLLKVYYGGISIRKAWKLTKVVDGNSKEAWIIDLDNLSPDSRFIRRSSVNDLIKAKK